VARTLGLEPAYVRGFTDAIDDSPLDTDNPEYRAGLRDGEAVRAALRAAGNRL
jgi:hypothetical protein